MYCTNSVFTYINYSSYNEHYGCNMLWQVLSLVCELSKDVTNVPKHVAVVINSTVAFVWFNKGIF
jgi:hypothetical protein